MGLLDKILKRKKEEPEKVYIPVDLVINYVNEGFSTNDIISHLQSQNFSLESIEQAIKIALRERATIPAEVPKEAMSTITLTRTKPMGMLEMMPNRPINEPVPLVKEPVLHVENKPPPETVQAASKPDLSLEKNDKEIIIKYDNEKTDQILAELKALYVLLKDHDNHLTSVDSNILSHLSEIMARKKEIPQDEKLQVEAILKGATNRSETIEKLKALGISQASAYRYTEFLKEINDKK